MKSRKLIRLSAVVVLAIFLASFTYFKKEAIACEFIGFTHFTEVSDNVYVDQSISPVQQVTLVETVQAAVQRVSDIYGAPTSNPRIIATSETHYGKLGFNPTGMQSSGFFHECIFLGPKGLNVDVVAHELVHAEVRHRTTLLVELTQLPAWFIEGTGIKVDYRPPFLLQNMAVSEAELAHIKSVFYLSDFPNTKVEYYQASRMAVEPMNPKLMYEGLERVNKGESFKEVFKALF